MAEDTETVQSAPFNLNDVSPEFALQQLRKLCASWGFDDARTDAAQRQIVDFYRGKIRLVVVNG